jgi:hypothetical protein
LWPAKWLLEVARDARAQDSFEYVLVLGGVSVATIFAIATPVGGGLIQSVLDGTCAATATIVPQVGC